MRAGMMGRAVLPILAVAAAGTVQASDRCGTYPDYL